MIWFNSDPQHVTSGPFRTDALVWYTRGLSLTVGAVLVMVMWNQIDDAHSAEAHACLLSIIAGTSLVAAANDLVWLFLALELVSIPTYVLLYLLRSRSRSREATLKYFLLSVFSSALVLYGMSWLYGAAGTTNLTAIAELLRVEECGGRSADCSAWRWHCLWPGCRFGSRRCRFTFMRRTCFKAWRSRMRRCSRSFRRSSASWR